LLYGFWEVKVRSLFYMYCKVSLGPTKLISCFSNLVLRPHLSRGKRSGEPSWISWAYYWNVVRTNEMQYRQLLRSTHFTDMLQCAKAQDCFPVLAFDLIRECYVVATTSEVTSCARLK